MTTKQQKHATYIKCNLLEKRTLVKSINPLDEQTIGKYIYGITLCRASLPHKNVTEPRHFPTRSIGITHFSNEKTPLFV